MNKKTTNDCPNCPDDKGCPNGGAILKYANDRGLKNSQLVNKLCCGWELVGEGRDDRDWPLVWRIVQECGINRGGGGSNYHQIDPTLFKLPEIPKRVNLFTRLLLFLKLT